MEFKRCERCGCFFTSSSNICSNCQPKESLEIYKLKSYFEDSMELSTIEELSYGTGITIKNLNRHLQNNEIKSQYDCSKFSNMTKA